MKRILSALMCVALMICALPIFTASAQTVSEVMCVVKCNEWVSLRKSPDKNSTRLEKVHLGELVTECKSAENGFIYCDFDGKKGYILAEYLETTPFTLSDGILPNQMVVNCDEWVSLREKPDSSSNRILKVPKGAIVTRCVSWMGSFVFCRYKGKDGYILSKYLKKADYTVKTTPTPTVTPKLTPTPTPTPTPVPTSAYVPLPYLMKVVNCTNYVSLRALPNTASAQLDRVSLGELVSDCARVDDKFIYCTYNGLKGYILSEYLEPYFETETVDYGPTFDMLGEYPALNEFNAIGEQVAQVTFEGCMLIARRTYVHGDEFLSTSDHEQLMLVCYSALNVPMWSELFESDYTTELTITHAFEAGTIDAPLMVVFVAHKGLWAYEAAAVKNLRWMVLENDTDTIGPDGKYPEPVLGVGGSPCTAVEKDGTIYMCGYYDSAPVCISSQDGAVLWHAVNNNYNSIYWPYKINLTQTGIEVLYDSYMDGQDKCYVISYNENGIVTGIRVSSKTEVE
ncbi:MAG: hypothetical protein IKR85_11040 [Clostridia bacterium]|nr:hypothetical protein [Clostridia bacterium]